MIAISANCADAAGKNGNTKRSKPYAAVLIKIPAKSTEPAVGACACASGNQPCNGNTGSFTAKPTNKHNMQA